MMPSRCIRLFALLPALLTAPAAAQTPRIGVDRRVELMAIIFKLAGSREYNQNRFTPYIAAIEGHFGPFRNHEAVTLARGLREQHGIGFSAVMSIAIRLTDPPALQSRVPVDTTGPRAAMGVAMLRFVAAARRFVVDANAAAFFTAHRALYDSADARMRRPVERGSAFEWVGRFFGVPADRLFVVVPLLANSGTNFGPCVEPPDQRRECYSILGHERTDSAGFPSYDEDLVPTLVHELSHGYANPLVETRQAEFERSAPRIHAQVADAMRAQAYGSWTSMMNESLVNAAVARYLRAQKGEPRMRQYLADQRAGSWFWLEELSNLFGEYEADRRTYPTVATFMPRMVAYFDSLPDRLPDMQRRYGATRPRLLSVSITNGAEDVDPGLRELVLRFDRPVTDDGLSVVPTSGAAERMPKIIWKSLDTARTTFERGKGFESAGTTFKLGIELAPGREYEMQFNTPHGRGFRGATDRVPLAPYRLKFKTRS